LIGEGAMQRDLRYNTIPADTKIISRSFGLFPHHVVELVPSKARNFQKNFAAQNRD